MAEEEKIREHSKHALQVLTDKTKKWKDRIKDFLWEVFIILVAVNITIWFHNWSDKRHEKKDMILYLNTIKLELEDNKKMLDETVIQLQPSVRYADYLRTHDKKTLNADTIKSYAQYYLSANNIRIKTNAFDMFKTSGNMRLVDDKELLLSIWEIYAKLADIEQAFNTFMQLKVENMIKASQLYSLYDITSLSDEVILKNVPLYNFYAHISAPYAQAQLCKNGSALINEMLLKFK